MAAKQRATKGLKRATRKRTPATRVAPPIPDDKRGRRGHSIINEDPKLRAWLVQALQRRPAPTLDELVEEAKATGFAIGRTAIWSFRVAFEAELARKELVLELARLYNRAGDDGNVLDIETAIGNMFAYRIYAQIVERDELDEKALKLLDAFRKLQSSSSQRERTRFHVERGVRNTTLRIRGLMQQVLKKDPDTLRRVLAAVDQAAAEVRE